MGDPRKLTSETARDIETYVWNGSGTILYTKVSRLVAQNPDNVVNWWTDHAGKVRAGVTNEGVNTTVL